MQKKLETVKRLAKDLNCEEPRSPDEEIGGYPFAARCLDKCRATLVGLQSDYTDGSKIPERRGHRCGGIQSVRRHGSIGRRSGTLDRRTRAKSGCSGLIGR